MKLSPSRIQSGKSASAFTMVEIAICLAIIGIALVGIIGVLPIGMNTQRATREETLINQDVATLLPAIAHGLRGNDDLTNYVYAITNYVTLYKNNGTIDANGSAVIGQTFSSASVTGTLPGYYYGQPPVPLTNGANIVGSLSIPEFVGNTIYYPAVPVVTNTFTGYQVYSNHIVAYVHAFSGLASEKPPQDNPLMVNDSFTYRMLVVNAPIYLDSDSYYKDYNQQLWKNQHELRLTFFYPLQPNGSVGPNQLSFRTTVAGQLSQTNVNSQFLYFYQPQSFGVNTNQ